MADPIESIRSTPNNFSYSYKDFHTGTLKKVHRSPGDPNTKVLPKDMVVLTTERNEDWQPSDVAMVKEISPKHPEVLQLEKADGSTTFVSAYEVQLSKRAPENRAHFGEGAEGGLNPYAKYLSWP